MDYKPEIIVRNENLPSTIEDLSRFVLVGREKMVSVRAEIRAIDKLGLGKEVRQQKLDEGQVIADALLDAEVRLGELTREIPKQPPEQRFLSDSGVAQAKPKKDTLAELGFTPKQAERFETLAEHPEIVAQAKAEARENDDIVSRSLVLAKIKEKDREDKRNSIVFENQETSVLVGKYNIIYADPPWRYDFSETKMRDIENQYPTMSIDEIKGLDIPSADNSVLLLWATAPKLPEAIAVLKSWGFDYKTCAVWDKEIIGMGYWFRGQHEMLLVGTKGSFSPPPPNVRYSSVHTEKRTTHSTKPAYYYDMIESMFPQGKYLELFARNKHSEKWEVWGNQV